jgi:hypothetical protein
MYTCIYQVEPQHLSLRFSGISHNLHFHHASSINLPNFIGFQQIVTAQHIRKIYSMALVTTFYLLLLDRLGRIQVHLMQIHMILLATLKIFT